MSTFDSQDCGFESSSGQFFRRRSKVLSMQEKGLDNFDLISTQVKARYLVVLEGKGSGWVRQIGQHNVHWIK